MKMYRCLICGETFLGYEPPSNCPFCGAHRELLVDPREFPADINEIDLTEVEHADLEAAVELERSNTRFYLAMSANAGNEALASAYKRLARVEAEHCSVFSKLLMEPKPANLMEPGDASTDWLANIDESLSREQRASRFYADAAARATNARLREVLAAVSAVEVDHIALDEVAKTYL